jgi:hypothetical protein
VNTILAALAYNLHPMTNMGHDWASSLLELTLHSLRRRAGMLILIRSLVVQRIFGGKHSLLLHNPRLVRPRVSASFPDHCHHSCIHLNMPKYVSIPLQTTHVSFVTRPSRSQTPPRLIQKVSMLFPICSSQRLFLIPW